jgi:DNA-directed RNA polymerase specialized sigma24 family protein
MSESQLNDLLADPDFAKFVVTASSELARARSIPIQRARGFVLSGLGDPAAYLKIHEAWITGQTALVKVILRRRAIDLLRKDAPRVKHCALPVKLDELHTVLAAGGSAVDFHWAVQVERRSVVRMVLEALDCFASLGEVQRRRAALIQRRVLENTSYAELSTELGVREGALRVQVHEAILAFREHLRAHLRARDPELSRQIPTP